MEDLVRKQIEYYLSEYNLSSDVHMTTAIKQYGGLTIDYLMECNRIKRFVKNDRSLLASVLQNIESSVFEVVDSGNLVRLRPKTPDNVKKEEIYLKTVYMRGFPTNCTESEIIDWCSVFGNVVKVYRNFPSEGEEFDGTVLVTFEEQSAADMAVVLLAMQKGRYDKRSLVRVKYPTYDLKEKIMARLFDLK